MAVQPVVAADVQAVGARGGARNGERVVTVYCLTNVQLLPQWVDLHAAAVIEQGLQPAAVVRGARDLAVVLPPSSAYDSSGLETLLDRSEEHTSELQSRLHLVCRLLLEKKKRMIYQKATI